MIITFTKRDYDIVESAIQDQKLSPSAFGVLYCYLSGHSYPKADQYENIFLTAHGNDREIGDANGFGLSAAKIADIIYDTFTGSSWAGGLYISTCNSYPTFAKAVLSQLTQRDPKRPWKVFGAKGPISYPILQGGHASWSQA